MTITQQDINALFVKMRQKFDQDKAQGMDAVIQFRITGEEETDYWVHVQEADLQMGQGEADAPRMTLFASANDFAEVVNGKTNAIQAFMSGKLKVKGEMSLAMKLQSIFGL